MDFSNIFYYYYLINFPQIKNGLLTLTTTNVNFKTKYLYYIFYAIYCPLIHNHCG